jgi:D-beta-D-heptose 7-phosphate kinase/D-beta-D-heptose 1-phosphate adenosyltransferase
MVIHRTAHQKIVALPELSRLVRRARSRGNTVVFTNGCFDLLHSGHLRVFERAKRLGDVLIVGVNSDRSVRALKGSGRPVVGQRDRALMVAALESVDYVTIFHQHTPLQLIAALRPHVLVKGADWGTGRIVGADVVEQDGGRVVRIPLLKGRSTTRLVARLHRL